MSAADSDKLARVCQSVSDLLDRPAGANAEPAGNAIQLNKLLLDDPQTCEAYLDLITMHAHLQWEFGSTVDPSKARVDITDSLALGGASAGPAENRPQWPASSLLRRTAAVAMAAAVLLVIGSVMVWRLPDWNGGQMQPKNAGSPLISGNSPPPNYVATLLDDDGAQWDSAGPSPDDGDHVRPGELHLQAGLAEFELFDGGVVLLQGPVRFSIASTNRVVLHAGMLTSTAPSGAAPLAIETAQATFTHSGGEIGVRVDSNGATEALAIEGAATIHTALGAPPGRRMFERGAAVRIDSADGRVRPVKISAAGFPQASRRIELLASGGFEPEQLVTPVVSRAAQHAAGRWVGHGCELVGVDDNVAPHQGRRMLKLRPTVDALLIGDSRVRAAAQWQLVDLRSLREAVAAGRVKASASVYFNRSPGAADAADQLAVGLHALRGDPNTFELVEASRRRCRSGRAVTEVATDADPQTWEQADVRLCIPRDAEYLLVELTTVAAPTENNAASSLLGAGDYFADAVELSLRVRPAPAESADLVAGNVETKSD